jgi:hypothetical protein
VTRSIVKKTGKLLMIIRSPKLCFRLLMSITSGFVFVIFFKYFEKIKPFPQVLAPGLMTRGPLFIPRYIEGKGRKGHSIYVNSKRDIICLIAVVVTTRWSLGFIFYELLY